MFLVLVPMSEISFGFRLLSIFNDSLLQFCGSLQVLSSVLVGCVDKSYELTRHLRFLTHLELLQANRPSRKLLFKQGLPMSHARVEPYQALCSLALVARPRH